MFARTNRLLLRPSWPEDAQELCQAVADELIVRNLGSLPWPYGIDDARAFVERENSPELPSLLLMLRTDGAPRLIGACGLQDADGQAELGYWIARPYWGLGFATEAAKAVVEIARAAGHRKLVAGHFTDNPASARVLHKAGFRPTGRVEMRQSNGRGRAVACALFERSLIGDESGGDGGMRCEIEMPYDAQLIAA